MDTRRGARALERIAIGAVVSLLTAWPAPGAAQPAPKPAVAEARIAITMGQDGSDAVEATYTVVNTAGLKDGVVEHALVRRPGAELGPIEASGATTGSPQIDTRQGISSVRVTVSGEPATYTLRYGVRRAPGSFAVPIPTPRIPVARSASNVAIETALPPGTRADGEWFPSVERVETRDGRTVLVHRVINVPSMAIAEYDRGGFLTPSQWTTLLGVGFLLVVVIWWFLHAVRTRAVAGHPR
jgi:hypothetical protein